MHEIRLVDFGFASKFIDKDGQHIKLTNTEIFRGNMVFASVSQFDFIKTTRRDDLISLCYLLVYMFNKGDVPYVHTSNKPE